MRSVYFTFTHQYIIITYLPEVFERTHTHLLDSDAFNVVSVFNLRGELEVTLLFLLTLHV